MPWVGRGATPNLDDDDDGVRSNLIALGISIGEYLREFHGMMEESG
jgi:hypothetical protein